MSRSFVLIVSTISFVLIFFAMLVSSGLLSIDLSYTTAKANIMDTLISPFFLLPLGIFSYAYFRVIRGDTKTYFYFLSILGLLALFPLSSFFMFYFADNYAIKTICC